ncbi:cytochrome c biogenesis protein CcsA [Aeoliella mucimassa]|uniref:Cytochrome C assembly protein n=1 Tax=Aeoliella mucimassa TaxID=2527972 RepID=A0A518AWC0_9BACT|nr:cytochrome c biogenesis protein CcsA [Aeoliella mucimassa]QDU59024.1 Cytochrome C assembly protein [Aeoliella mucimassa]
MSGVTVFCFVASYAVALALEVAGLWVRFGWHRLAMVVMAVAGLVAHSWFLASHSMDDVAILGSPENWYLVVAWVLAASYLWVVFTAPNTAMGLFVLPLVLLVIAIGEGASHEPFAAQQASKLWSNLHGVFMMLATVTVCVGFLAGLMYLIQSWRLKRKVPSSREFQLPSLEWLERTNSRALGLSAILVAGGFISGLILSRIVHGGEANYRLLADPVVLSLLFMLLWLVAAELFRMVYPSARVGRKVAYLTLASFGFLVITLIVFSSNAIHGSPPPRDTTAQLSTAADRTTSGEVWQ